MLIKKIARAVLKKIPGGDHLLSKEFAGKEALKLSSEKQFILKNIIRLNHLTVSDVMVPRTDIVWLDLALPLEENLNKIKDFSHTRYPICHHTLDNILGKIHIKEIILQKGSNVDLNQYIEKILFVSPTMLCLDLLVQMKEEKNYMAVVVDEFGGVDGLVTGDTLVEKIVGQLEFSLTKPSALYEYDPASRSVVADGRCSIEVFENSFGMVLTKTERESNPETLAGLVLLLAGRIPNRGEIIKHSTGLTFEAIDVHNRGIKRMRIYNLGVLSKDKS